MTATITSDRARHDLRAGDQIIAIDGHHLPRPRRVANPNAVAGINVPAINLVNELGTDTEWNLYPGAFDELTVERELAATEAETHVEEPVAAKDEESDAAPFAPTGRTSVTKLQPGQHVWLTATGARIEGRRDLAGLSDLRSGAALARHERTAVVSVTRQDGEYLTTVRTAAGTVHEYPPQTMLATAPAGSTQRTTRQPRTRIVSGLTLVCRGEGRWETQDGNYIISREQRGTTMCEDPHPVRLTRAMVEAAYANPHGPVTHDIIAAHRSGKKGYLCPGGTEHDGPPTWVISSDDNSVEGLFSTLGWAADYLARRLDEG